MRVDAEKDGIARMSTGDNDDRITPVGRVIRACRMDELPQLFNILAGSMSVVGPRPERPEIAAQYEHEIPEFQLRLQAKAGLTGYAQVYGKYNTTPYDKLQMDLMYIANPSLIEDLKIIFATLKILPSFSWSEDVDETLVDTCDDLSVVRSAGQAFGDFQMLLSDFDAEHLFYTIPDFHNTRKRYEKLKADMASDPCGRVSEVRDELDWLLSMEDEACRLTDLFNAGKLPLRVTHNDTKINNVLFDEKSREALVVIDLDTVMPGLVGHDFGDAIRFAANFVEEDCPQADKAGVNLNIYWAFAEGFIKETAATLTEAEVNTLGISCFALACELATRFLDDYILGDKYFKINYPEHNLVRTRCQIALAKDMRKKMDAMNAIARDCWMRYR